MRRMIATALLCLLACSNAQAARHAHGQQFCRTYSTDAGATAFRCWSRSEARQSARSFRHRVRVAHARRHRGGAVARVHDQGQIVAHPAGCPSRAFCGCGVARYIFGSPVRALWLAAAWLRYPPAAPGPGMVAVARGGHHVFAIVAVHSPGVVMAYDPNSGRHRTRIHLRSLAGYRVVNPRAG